MYFQQYWKCARPLPLGSLPRARGLCPFAARSLRQFRRQVCRPVAQAQADRHIQLDQVCETEQRQPAATCIGAAPLLHAEVPWQSWLAVVHEDDEDLMPYLASPYDNFIKIIFVAYWNGLVLLFS